MAQGQVCIEGIHNLEKFCSEFFMVLDLNPS